MLQWDANPEWDRKLLELRHSQGQLDLRSVLTARGATAFSEIARRLNQWFGVSHFTKDNVQKRYAILTPPPAGLDIAPVHTPYLSKYFDEYGKLKDPAPTKVDLEQYVAKLHEHQNRSVKTLVVSDQQGCFANEDLLNRIYDENPYADLIVCPGDIVEWYAASRYIKDRDIPLAHEADWLVRVLEGLERRYGVPVVITGSNHQRRMTNAVRQLPTGMLFLVEANPEAYLSQPFTNVHAFERWWWQSGDVIYSHSEGRTREPGDNAKWAIDQFLDKRALTLAYELPPEHPEHVREFSAVLTGHSHKLATVHYKTKWGFEPGCTMRLPADYMRAAHVSGGQSNGYAVIVQRGGRLQINQSGVFSL